MPIDITRTTLEPRQVLARHLMSSMTTIGDDIGTHMPPLFHYLMSQQGQLAGAPIAIYPDEVFNPDSFNLILALPIGAPVDPIDPYTLMTLPGGHAVMHLHRGHYDQLHAKWQEFMKEIHAQGLQPKSPIWEEYITDPGDKPPEEWETLLVCPVAE